jgi:hypothetical protein
LGILVGQAAPAKMNSLTTAVFAMRRPQRHSEERSQEKIARRFFPIFSSLILGIAFVEENFSNGEI